MLREREVGSFQPCSSGEDPPCGATWESNWDSVPFDICILNDFSYADAVRVLTEAYGTWSAAEDALWDLVGVGRPRRDGIVASNLVGDLWDDWNSHASVLNYYAEVSETPRREVALRTLQLIEEFDEGLPVEFDSQAVRAAVADRIASGTMSYMVYTSEYPSGPDLLEDPEAWAVEQFIKPENCHGVRNQQFASGPYVGPSDAADACASIDCNVTNIYDLRDRIEFAFEWQGVVEWSAYDTGNNHGALSARVWLCNITLDRAAVLYDWLVALATRHLAQAVKGAGLEHLQAANIVLRMALSVCARLGVTVIHETSHNLSLWHCAEPEWWEDDEHDVGCVQDAAGWAWRVYLTAKLGLPGYEPIRDHDPTFPTGTRSNAVVYWKPSLGDDMAHDGAYGSAYREGAIECKQGTVVSAADLAEMAAWSVALEVASVVNPSNSVLFQVAAKVLAFAASELDLGSKQYADIYFTITHPLQREGVVSYCCIRNRSLDCARTSTIPCWSSDAPDGAKGCCDGDETSDATSVPEPGGCGYQPPAPPRLPPGITLERDPAGNQVLVEVEGLERSYG